MTVHKGTMPFTAFRSATRLFEGLSMPQGSSTAPGWFVEVINEIINGFELPTSTAISPSTPIPSFTSPL